MNRPYLTLCCIVALLAAVPFSAAAKQEPGHPGCDTADACLDRLRHVSGNKRGLGADDKALVDRLLSFGPDIVPALVDVLADPNGSAAELAG